MDVRMTISTGWAGRLVAALLLVALGIGSTLGDDGIGATGGITHVALVYTLDDARVVEVAVAVDDALAKTCGDDCPGQVRLSSHSPEPDAIAAAARISDLVVTIGSAAARRVARAQITTPTLYSFLPQAAWQDLAACCVTEPERRHALLIDQPFSRQFALLRALLPEARRVAVLLGPASRTREGELRDVADNAGYTLQVGEVGGDNDVGSMLRRVMPGADAVLAIPDPAVYNRNSIYAILLTTYGAGVPVIGYSQTMVTAGATAAVFASTADVGMAIARRIALFKDKGRLEPTGFGDVFSFAVNSDVARSLRLSVPAEGQLRERLEAAP
jgi:putative tryptophan/tyrosine transport system substrate-binding protein